MQLHFWLKGDSRTYGISDEEELIRLMSDNEKYCKDPNLSKRVGYYTFEDERGNRFQKRSVIFYEIDKMELLF